MTERYLAFHDEDVRLTDLVTPDDPELHDVHFERCRITGPAVMQPLHTQFVASDYGIGRDHLDAALWTVSPWTDVVVGSIVARNCVFRDCVFDGIAFAGVAELTAEVRSAVIDGRIAS